MKKEPHMRILFAVCLLLAGIGAVLGIAVARVALIAAAKLVPARMAAAPVVVSI